MGERGIVAGYLRAKLLVIEAGYGGDVDWADGLQDVEPDDAYVVREAAWVILNSGFRYAVAQTLWPRLSAAFCDWKLEAIDGDCVAPALEVLNHPGKIDAMLSIAQLVQRDGSAAIVADAQEPPTLRRLPFIGTITCWHLAKVLGVDCVKPDVHLQRAADAAGEASALALCEAIRDATGDRLTVVDSVLWRYGEQRQARGWPAWPQFWGDDT